MSRTVERPVAGHVARTESVGKVSELDFIWVCGITNTGIGSAFFAIKKKNQKKYTVENAYILQLVSLFVNKVLFYW